MSEIEISLKGQEVQTCCTNRKKALQNSFLSSFLRLCISFIRRFLIYKIASIPTHFPRRTLLFFLECETTSIMLPKQSVVSIESPDGSEKHLSLTVNHFFLQVVLFRGVNLRLH